MLGIRFKVLGFGFLGFWFWGFGIRVLGFGFGVLGFVCRVWGSSKGLGFKGLFKCLRV